jgi:hypothetical protein
MFLGFDGLESVGTTQSVARIRPTAKGEAVYIGIGTIVVILVVLLLIGVLR